MIRMAVFCMLTSFYYTCHGGLLGGSYNYILANKHKFDSALEYKDCRIYHHLDGQKLVVMDLEREYPVLGSKSKSNRVVFSRFLKIIYQNKEVAVNKLYKWQQISKQCWERKTKHGPSALNNFFDGDILSGIGFLHSPSQGSRAQVISDGKQALSYRLNMIKNARKSIYIRSFEFFGDRSGRKIVKALIEKKYHSNLDIRVAFDAFSLWSQAETLIENSLALMNNLVAAGIPVHGFFYGKKNPFLYETFKSFNGFVNLNYRAHEKAFIVDAGTKFGAAIIGGRNISDTYFQLGGEKWFDMDVYLEGGVVGDICQSFLNDWQKYQEEVEPELEVFNPYNSLVTAKKYKKHLKKQWQRYKKHKGDERIQELQVKNDLKDLHVQGLKAPELAHIRFIKNAPKLGFDKAKNLIESSFVKIIAASKREIIIGNLYFMPSRAILKALRQALVRGVRISVISNSPNSNYQQYANSLSRYNYYLLQNNVPKNFFFEKRNQLLKFLNKEKHLIKEQLFLYEFNPAPETNSHGVPLWHAKYVVIDRRYSFVSSFNLDARSRNLSREHGVWIDSVPCAYSILENFLTHVENSVRIDSNWNFRHQKRMALKEKFKLRLHRLLAGQY